MILKNSTVSQALCSARWEDYWRVESAKMCVVPTAGDSALMLQAPFQSPKLPTPVEHGRTGLEGAIYESIQFGGLSWEST